MDWIYGQIVGFLGNFFALMGNMGVELFELDWVNAIVLFFSRLGWALFAVSVVVCAFECGIEYSAGRGNLQQSALNVIKGFLAVSLFTVVPVRLYHASRKEYMDTEKRWQRLLDHLDGKELTSAGHLSAREFTFGDEIIEHDEKLNFYVEAEFDVDTVFGTHVLTDENDDWLNIYANYDTQEDRVCDTLDVTLCKGDGSEEYFSYQLNAAEQEVLLRKMEAYCQTQTGMSLCDYSRQLREEQEQEQGFAPEMKM